MKKSAKIALPLTAIGLLVAGGVAFIAKKLKVKKTESNK